MPEQASGMRLVLLGTAGGPRPQAARSAPAQAILAGGQVHVIDCGGGVARQLVRAGIPLATLRRVFVTHHHSDHNADLGNLLLLAWAAGLHTPVDVYAPPPLGRMRELYLALNATDITIREADERRPRFAPLWTAHELAEPGTVVEDAALGLKVTAALVHHPPVEPSFAYRFDAPDRAIVISGDTTPCQALVDLARGADVLVHEVMYAPAIDRLAARVGYARSLAEHLRRSHTTAEQAGQIATAAGVRTLVLSHFVPGDDPQLSDELWLEAAASTFSGQIIVGHDLQVI